MRATQTKVPARRFPPSNSSQGSMAMMSTAQTGSQCSGDIYHRRLSASKHFRRAPVAIGMLAGKECKFGVSTGDSDEANLGRSLSHGEILQEWLRLQDIHRRENEAAQHRQQIQHQLAQLRQSQETQERQLIQQQLLELRKRQALQRRVTAGSAPPTEMATSTWNGTAPDQQVEDWADWDSLSRMIDETVSGQQNLAIGANPHLEEASLLSCPYRSARSSKSVTSTVLSHPSEVISGSARDGVSAR